MAPRCGEGAGRGGTGEEDIGMKKTEVKLQDAFKGFTADQDKVVPPEETVRRLRERLQRLELDILKETRRIDKGRLGIPVYVSRCGRDAAAATGTKKQMGKGATPAQAEASAVMELVERFSFFTFCNAPGNFLVAPYGEVKEEALDYGSIARSVHDETDEPEALYPLFAAVPMRWVWAWNLSRGRHVRVPFDWFYRINEFNGPSAGNCVEEALSQGICEIVERHVSSLVSRSERTPPAVDPDSAADPAVVEMIAKYRAAGVRFHVSDFSLGMGVPTVAVLAWDPSTLPGRSEIVWTAGTTPDPEKALSRALTEVAQLAGDFDTEARYVASGLPKFSHLDQARYVWVGAPTVPLSSLPDISDDNIRVEVENLAAALSARGMEILVVDTRHPGLQVPAFYTIVPGAHFRERALGTGVGMFTARIVAETYAPAEALETLEKMERVLPGKAYLPFYAGLAHLNGARPTEALKAFREALSRGPNPEEAATIRVYAGVCLKEMERYGEALEVLRGVEALDADRTDALNLMGYCHFKRGEHEAAIAAFEKILQRDPSSAIDYANIASNYRDMGQIDRAVAYYETALSLDPTLDFALENLLRLKGKS
jgi:ribosomal protein S12 methylthiotransferase accessory factor